MSSWPSSSSSAVGNCVNVLASVDSAAMIETEKRRNVGGHKTIRFSVAFHLLRRRMFHAEFPEKHKEAPLTTQQDP